MIYKNTDFRLINILQKSYNFSINTYNARVAELVDALGSGPSRSNPVGVRVSSRAIFYYLDALLTFYKICKFYNNIRDFLFSLSMLKNIFKLLLNLFLYVVISFKISDQTHFTGIIINAVIYVPE
jgi:hypothetical protein